MNALRCACLLATTLLFSGCASYLGAQAPVADDGAVMIPITAPSYKPFYGSRYFRLTSDMRYRVGQTPYEVVVPSGFVTDLASIPNFLHSIIPKDGRHSLPAIVHDYLYWNQTCSRLEADRLFRAAMVEMEVPTHRRQMIYLAVRRAGGAAFRDNRTQRAAGIPRVLPTALPREPTAMESWGTYSQFLLSKGVKSAPEPAVPRAFCEQGNT